MQEQNTYIKHLKIEGLWNRYDVDWELNPDVNILVGENGSGKSAILSLIYVLAKKKFTIYYKNVNTNNVKIQFSNKEDFQDFGSVGFQENFIYSKGEGAGLSRRKDEEVDFGFDVQLINSFETKVFTRDEYLKIKEPNIITFLDYELKDAINEYNKYQLGLNKKSSKGESFNDVYKKQKYFIETINRLFSFTQKKFDDDSVEFEFLVGKNNQRISAYDLSSGEKQLIILLLSVLCQDEKPCILLLDEPEISLHFEWQYELINIIRTLNPNCQLIIATHSVGIFAKGWNDKFFDMLPGKHGRNPILKPIND